MPENEVVPFGQKVRANPIKTAISVLTLVSMIVTGVLWVDARYLHAGGLAVIQQQQARDTVFFNNKMTHHSIDEINLEIFKITFKINEGTATALDKALLTQYNQQLRQKEAQIMTVPK